MHEISWKDKSLENKCVNEIKEAEINGLDIVEISTPPDFVIVKLINQENNKIRDKSDFPSEFNLNEDSNNHCILLPLMLNRQGHQLLKIKDTIINYLDHNLTLAYSLTVWKVQGGTFKKIIIHLEPSDGQKSQTYENIYVAVSRVKSNDSIRYFPLSPTLKKRKSKT